MADLSKTYLELVQDVMRRLRHQVPSTITANRESILIGALVNEAKREVEEAWPWLETRTSIAVITTPLLDLYTLSTVGQRFRINQVIDDTNNTVLYQQTWSEWQKREDTETTSQTGKPTYWRVNGFSAGRNPKIQFYPTPAGAYTIKVHGNVAQAELSSALEILTVPWYPVMLKAYALAIAERGQNQGVTFSEADLAYERALQEAIAQDNLNNESRSTDWYVA